MGRITGPFARMIYYLTQNHIGGRIDFPSKTFLTRFENLSITALHFQNAKIKQHVTVVAMLFGDRCSYYQL